MTPEHARLIVVMVVLIFIALYVLAAFLCASVSDRPGERAHIEGEVDL